MGWGLPVAMPGRPRPHRAWLPYPDPAEYSAGDRRPGAVPLDPVGFQGRQVCAYGPTREGVHLPGGVPGRRLVPLRPTSGRLVRGSSPRSASNDHRKAAPHSSVARGAAAVSSDRRYGETSWSTPWTREPSRIPAVAGAVQNGRKRFSAAFTSTRASASTRPARPASRPCRRTSRPESR